MHRRIHILGEHSIDLTLPLHAGFSRKSSSRDFHTEMRFATFPPTSVTVVFIGLVNDTQFLRLEGSAQLAFKAIGDFSHGGPPELSVVAQQGGIAAGHCSRCRKDGYAAPAAMTSDLGDHWRR
jgi:hypothetical protein